MLVSRQVRVQREIQDTMESAETHISLRRGGHIREPRVRREAKKKKGDTVSRLRKLGLGVAVTLYCCCNDDDSESRNMAVIEDIEWRMEIQRQKRSLQLVFGQVIPGQVLQVLVCGLGIACKTQTSWACPVVFWLGISMSPCHCPDQRDPYPGLLSFRLTNLELHASDTSKWIEPKEIAVPIRGLALAMLLDICAVLHEFFQSKRRLMT